MLLLLLCDFGNFTKAGFYIFCALAAVGNNAVFAVFNSLFGIIKVSAAFVAQSIKRAITKKAVKILRLFGFVAGKIFTFPMLKKACFLFFHGFSSVSAFGIHFVHDGVDDAGGDV